MRQNRSPGLQPKDLDFAARQPRHDLHRHRQTPRTRTAFALSHHETDHQTALGGLHYPAAQPSGLRIAQQLHRRHGERPTRSFRTTPQTRSQTLGVRPSRQRGRAHGRGRESGQLLRAQRKTRVEYTRKRPGNERELQDNGFPLRHRHAIGRTGQLRNGLIGGNHFGMFARLRPCSDCGTPHLRQRSGANAQKLALRHHDEAHYGQILHPFRTLHPGL